MIFEKKFILEDVKSVLIDLCGMFFAYKWEIFGPAYMAFTTDAEYEARAISTRAGCDAFLLSSEELHQFIADDLIGFDWTDLRLLRKEDDLLYLQIVDECVWYARTDDVAIARVAEAHGLLKLDQATLPFGEAPRLNVKSLS